MSARIKNCGVALAAGIMFGAGLAISGMTRPQKVIGFLDPFGAWDPSLALVMMGAIGVHLIAYRLIRRRSRPLLAPSFSIPTQREIDLRLVAGAALFGVGWGLAGYCPGPAVSALATGSIGVTVFVLTMLLGMLVTARIETAYAKSTADAHAAAGASTARQPAAEIVNS